jgi:hypothetical protein
MSEPDDMSGQGTSFDQRGQTVLRQFNAETINYYASEQAAIQARQWRDIESVGWGIIRDSENSRAVFVQEIFFALREAFQPRPYKKFNALLRLDTTQPETGEGVPFYFLASHEVGFIAALRRRHKAFLNMMNAAHLADPSARAEIRSRYKESVEREEQIWQGWNRTGRVGFSSKLSLLELTYDAQTSSITAYSPSSYSLDPADYPDHVGTTSELLRYIAGIYNQAVRVMGDISWAMKDFRLMKLVIDVLDHRPIDLSNIRIDVNDFEAWDYLNLEFERELAERSQTNLKINRSVG